MEHAGPGKYDREFVNYTIEVLKIIEEVGGLYVFLNFIKMFGHGILEAVEHLCGPFMRWTRPKMFRQNRGGNPTQ